MLKHGCFWKTVLKLAASHKSESLSAFGVRHGVGKLKPSFSRLARTIKYAHTSGTLKAHEAELIFKQNFAKTINLHFLLVPDVHTSLWCAQLESKDLHLRGFNAVSQFFTQFCNSIWKVVISPTKSPEMNGKIFPQRKQPRAAFKSKRYAVFFFSSGALPGDPSPGKKCSFPR